MHTYIIEYKFDIELIKSEVQEQQAFSSSKKSLQIHQ